MRRSWQLSRVAVLSTACLGLVLGGCKTDQATHHAEQLDSGVSSGHDQTVYPSRPSAPEQSSSQASAPAAAASRLVHANDHRPLIVCFGDSLTAGYGTDAGESYPDDLQTLLDQAGYPYRVVNEGISGNTTKDGLDRVADVIAMKPAVVVLEFGGNDGLRGLPIKDSRANLDAMLAKLTAATPGTPKIRVMLAGITLPPDYGPDYIAQFRDSYVVLAKKYKVPLLPFLLKGVYGVPGMMQADETHATKAGNAVVAGNVMGVLTPLLKK